jgi:hypothetical protein
MWRERRAMIRNNRILFSWLSGVWGSFDSRRTVVAVLSRIFGVHIPKIVTPDTITQSTPNRHTLSSAGSAMVVLDEKTMLPPPPPYTRPRTTPSFSPLSQPINSPPFDSPPPSSVTLSDLPSHLLLHIVHRSFPQAPDKSYNKLERQRKTLHWLTTSLRLVNRTFYIGKLLPFPITQAASTWILSRFSTAHLYLSSCPHAEKRPFF